jgi:hypothetical protein
MGVAPLIVIVVFAAACSTAAVTPRHPDRRTLQCGPYYSQGMASLAAAQHEAKCIDDFSARGFQRVAR